MINKIYFNNSLKSLFILLLVAVMLLVSGCGNAENTSGLSVEDTTAPVIKGEDVEIFEGDAIDYASLVTVTDDTDNSPQLNIDSSKVNADEVGVYFAVYTATDASGNSSQSVVKITVKEKDVTPPVVKGEDFEITEGDSVSYKKQIIVTDDFDNNPVIEIDNSQVDLETPGVYPVVYTVTDASGNSTVLELKLTVNKKVVSPEMSEEYVIFEAGNILETIIKEDDSDLQKLYSIYRWCKNNIGYTGDADKTNWVIGAYEGFINRSGDCYTYYAVSKALVTAAGFENHDVIKLRKETDPNRHYWLLVKLDGEYYHFDTTRFRFDKSNFCMLTDEEIWGWDNEYYPGTHTYDNTGLPAVSTNSVQDKIDYSSDRLIKD